MTCPISARNGHVVGHRHFEIICNIPIGPRHPCATRATAKGDDESQKSCVSVNVVNAYSYPGHPFSSSCSYPLQIFVPLCIFIYFFRITSCPTYEYASVQTPTDSGPPNASRVNLRSMRHHAEGRISANRTVRVIQ